MHGRLEKKFETREVIDGIKVVGRKGKTQAGTPLRAQYSRAYLTSNKYGQITQYTKYGGGELKSKDLDIIGEHRSFKNPKAKRGLENVHAHEYDSIGRRKKPRKPSPKELRIAAMLKYKRRMPK